MRVYLQAPHWRVLRRMLQTHPEPRPLSDLAGWAVRAGAVVALLATKGLVERTPDGRVRLTPDGVAACEFGEYEERNET